MSGHESIAHRYREVAVKTANPLQLIVMLYDAAICSLQEAQEHIRNKNIAARASAINRCTAIISELQSCLDLKNGGEIASSLDRLYDYMRRRIFTANVEQSAQPLQETEALLGNLRSAWCELVSQNPVMAPLPPEARIPTPQAAAGTQHSSLSISI